MIRLTRINNQPLVVNSDLIEHIESTPDTILSMTNGQKLVVLETVDEVIERVVLFRRNLLAIAAPSEGSWSRPQMNTQLLAHAPLAVEGELTKYGPAR